MLCPECDDIQLATMCSVLASAKDMSMSKNGTTGRAYIMAALALCPGTDLHHIQKATSITVLAAYTDSEAAKTRQRGQALTDDGDCELKHLFHSMKESGIFHIHSFCIHYLNKDEHVDPNNTNKFEAVDCNHQLIIWCMLGLKEWEQFQIVKLRWDNMDVNHLILNTLSQSINKINATGAITVSAFNTSLAHYKQYTLPAWATASGTPNFALYAAYVVHHYNLIFLFLCEKSACLNNLMHVGCSFLLL
ncbi:uncharacterized protein ACA1_056550 [Acanthamoeba castellanii str. Neff]|uniref:Uncharacterized protein n=1 Tax=Acanthamoeba castellanii (strain ATCC 30010 / Neff) TaxID=1257118 RepID=L8HI87_ACACF|nr:uncharacterized protein ACA1_056550 [Acanthamoeba castellanii str. Neff]ELR24413.1 hypothetical protein ACA1_056550 [Acanthamoeba castellanii str. Neff]